MNYFHLQNFKQTQTYFLHKRKGDWDSNEQPGKAEMLMGIAAFPVIDDKDNDSYIHTLKWLSLLMTAV